MASPIEELILAAYPDADPRLDYEIWDLGFGPYLSAWRIAGPIPAGVPTMAGSQLERWYQSSVALCRSAVALIDGTATPQRLYALGLGDAIAEAEAEASVGAGIVKEQAEEMAALWTAFGLWANAPISDAWAHGKTPLQILTELGGA
jgi:hypothetical protein